MDRHIRCRGCGKLLFSNESQIQRHCYPCGKEMRKDSHQRQLDSTTRYRSNNQISVRFLKALIAYKSNRFSAKEFAETTGLYPASTHAMLRASSAASIVSIDDLQRCEAGREERIWKRLIYLRP